MTTGEYGVQIKQTLFDGFQTRNNVAAAESQVRASVESLGDTEENILFKAAQAYMDVVRDRQVSVPTHQNARFLTEQARAARYASRSAKSRVLSLRPTLCAPLPWSNWPPPVSRSW